MGRKTSNKVRMYHRYLGFFLAGIMAVYAISGVTLIYRDTDVFKKKTEIETTLEPNLTADQVGKELKIRRFSATSETATTINFKNGSYDKTTGAAAYTKVETPYLLNKLQNFHKAETGDPLYFLNIFFGVSLLFFVVSAFWMFLPSTPIFKKGMWFAAAGLVLTLVLLFV
ncbi:membrane protein [Nonlabens sp. YIK11]|uniref:PepSY domain-containing protein n=1 Tax=Nonlabens sp. YIK11 TaxID=1453349 RepID=UPI0006DC6C11|nr:PepSY domain-containing protein [Nonlabens sp. YIK11]KQC33576.1 membrane protein [Nonlabens sp. YIK11]